MRCFLLALIFIASASAQEVRRAIPVTQQSSSSQTTSQKATAPFKNKNADENSCAWQATAEALARDPAIQAAWKNYQQERYRPMQQWAASELPSRMPQPKVVRYFFGGPDVLSVIAFFPEASIYILCGMEPIGKITPLDALSPDALEVASHQLGEAMTTFLLYGYFITKEMKTQMSSGPLQGVLPILLTFLALSDHRIVSVETLSLAGAPGVRIRFVSRANGQEQQLFYAQKNLSNEVPASFFKWLQSFGPGAAYLKAASYLLHEEEFSRTRQFLLKHSFAILQDDSGIPLHFFTQSAWNLYLFGDYRGPIELFKKYYQADLATAYAASGLRGPLFFGTGYHFGTTESSGAHLMLAVRKEIVPCAQPLKQQR